MTPRKTAIEPPHIPQTALSSSDAPYRRRSVTLITAMQSVTWFWRCALVVAIGAGLLALRRLVRRNSKR